MSKFLKIVEIAWLVIAGICLFEVVRLWGSGQQTLYYFGGFGLFAVAMFFIRRHQRRRYDRVRQEREQKS